MKFREAAAHPRPLGPDYARTQASTLHRAASPRALPVGTGPGRPHSHYCATWALTSNGLTTVTTEIMKVTTQEESGARHPGGWASVGCSQDPHHDTVPSLAWPRGPTPFGRELREEGCACHSMVTQSPQRRSKGQLL